MYVISDMDMEDKIWKNMKNIFNYPPSPKETVNISRCKIYIIPEKVWNDEQESLVNDILKQVCSGEIYALDDQHNCFIFDPHENIPPYTWWYDEESDCNVYFPTYYPDGDFYAFISMDYSFGVLGHPWKNEIYVTGGRLIGLFDDNMSALDIFEK